MVALTVTDAGVADGIGVEQYDPRRCPLPPPPTIPLLEYLCGVALPVVANTLLLFLNRALFLFYK